MKRHIALLSVSVLLVSMLFSGCGASKGGATAPASEPGNGAPPAALAPDVGYGGMADMTVSAEGRPESGSPALRDSKLIRRAALEIQATQFDEARAALDGLKERCGGYYETASVSGGDYSAKDGNRFASYTVRIPKEQYEAFLSAAGDVGHVVNRDESQEDVGEQYHDAELRLATQRTKYDRLLALLDKASTMEDIISLENAISETEYQIDQYTTDLKRYDALVDYATINIRLYEVVTVTDRPGEAEALSTRLGKAFTGGFSEFGNAVGNFFVWCAYNLMGIFFFAAVVAVGGMVAVKKLKKQKMPPTPLASEDLVKK